MKRSGVAIPGFKLKDGKVVADHDAREARLPVNQRIARRKSRKVKVVKRGKA